MGSSDNRTYEVTFCSRVAGSLNALFAKHPEWPFRRAEIEESKAIKRKRSDLRIYGDAKKLILAGEVKLPDTVEGRTPYNPDLVDDSAHQADNAGAEFFFTWNVNLLVRFDRKKWHLPLRERRVQEQRQRAGSGGGEYRNDELAADLWDGLTEDERQPLAEWFALQTASGKPILIPEGRASLPDATDMLDATTVVNLLEHWLIHGKPRRKPTQNDSEKQVE